MKEKIIIFLKEICPGADIINSTALMDDDILDSISIVRLVDAIESDFGVEITFSDISPENLNSVDAITRLVVKLSQGPDKDD